LIPGSNSSNDRLNRRRPFNPHWVGGLSFLLAIVYTAALALGQLNDPSVQGENIPLLPAKEPVLEYVLAGVFLLAALAIGFMPSKRSADESKKVRSPGN